MYEKLALAPAASTGNNTHAGVNVQGDYAAIVVQLLVEAIGATPTVTFTVQGSPDDPVTVTDANANWYPLAYVTDSTDTVANAAIVSTTVGGKVLFLANPIARRYRRFRLVSTLNTNVTYHADIHRVA